MKLATSKWLAYTFLAGLIPVLTRLLIWAATMTDSISPVAPPDIVAFGLVVHTSIINELEHARSNDKVWKTIQNGTAILFVALYCALYNLIVFGELASDLVDMRIILNMALVLATASTLLALATFHYLSR